MSDRRRGLFQKSEPFAANRSFEGRKARDSTTGSPQILYEARTFRIGHQHEDNGNASVSYSSGGRSRPADDKIRSHRNNLVGGDARLNAFDAWPVVVQLNVATRFPAELHQTVFERGGLRLSAGIARRESAHQHRDAPFPLWPLCPCCERPCGDYSAGERDELASLHSITSSARASNVGGMVNSSALAAVRLISSSNLVGNSIGKSPGLAPLRILSTKLAVRRQLSRRFVP